MKVIKKPSYGTKYPAEDTLPKEGLKVLVFSKIGNSESRPMFSVSSWHGPEHGFLFHSSIVPLWWTPLPNESDLEDYQGD